MRTQPIHSPWNIRQGDVMIVPSLCWEFLKGAFTPGEVEPLRALECDNLYNQHTLFLVGAAATSNVIFRNWYALSQKEEEYNRFKSEVVATMEIIKVGQERLAKEKADFEAYKRTEKWSAAAANKQVRSLTKILSQERKLSNEACACDNDKFYHLLQEIINMKAANSGLAKKEVAVVVAIEDAILAHNRMEDVALAELNGRLLEAEAEARAERARADAQSALAEVEKTRADAESARAVKEGENCERVLAQHTTSSGQLDDAKAMIGDFHADRQWMLDYGVVYIANAISSAPEVDVAVATLRAKARDAGYKAGYTECLTHVNDVLDKKFTDEQ
ncbi:hypothetical protein HanPI659440_Chr06g0228171 [Helianthus annuus]|nr:hypothetical protein HanPI659440_Chr06g0228171 [Helianthus annuus]